MKALCQSLVSRCPQELTNKVGVCSDHILPLTGWSMQIGWKNITSLYCLYSPAGVCQFDGEEKYSYLYVLRFYNGNLCSFDGRITFQIAVTDRLCDFVQWKRISIHDVNLCALNFVTPPPWSKQCIELHIVEPHRRIIFQLPNNIHLVSGIYALWYQKILFVNFFNLLAKCSRLYLISAWNLEFLENINRAIRSAVLLSWCWWLDAV